jgi:hypothetical protein
MNSTTLHKPKETTPATPSKKTTSSLAGQKCFFIFSSDPLTLNIYLRPEMVKRLSHSGHKFVIITEEHDSPYLKEYFDHPGFILRALEKGALTKVFRHNRLFGFFRTIRFYTYGTKKVGDLKTRNLVLKAFSQEEKERSNWKGARFIDLCLKIADQACRFRSIRGLLQILEQSLCPFDGHRHLYQEFKPDVTICGRLGYMDDALVLREARSNRVPSVSVIKNWDNTTTKGYRGCLPDHVIVWNETMKREAQLYHDVPASRLHICGVPFWDSYFHAGDFKNKNAFCAQYNLSIAKQTIYFAMTAPTHYRHNFKIIISILNAIRADQFSQPVQLLVRVHPFYVLSFGSAGGYSIKEIEDIEAEFGDLVAFSYPEIENVGSRELLSDSNQTALTEILTHSDLLVSVYSTQLIEGALFDLPLVNVSYHNWRDTDEPIGVISQFEHIQQIMQDNAITNCHNDKQLVEAIDHGLKSPEHLRDNRRTMADKLVPPEHRGKAANAIVDTFLGLVK